MLSHQKHEEVWPCWIWRGLIGGICHSRPSVSLFLLPADSDVESAAPSPVPGLLACYHASRHDETSEAVTLAVHLLSTLSPPFSGLAPTVMKMGHLVPKGEWDQRNLRSTEAAQ